jgi:hypothetical protein
MRVTEYASWSEEPARPRIVDEVAPLPPADAKRTAIESCMS